MSEHHTPPVTTPPEHESSENAAAETPLADTAAPAAEGAESAQAATDAAPSGQTVSDNAESASAGSGGAGSGGTGKEDDAKDQKSGDSESSSRREERPRQPTYVETLERRLSETQDQLREFIAAYKQVKEDKDSFKVRLEREFSKEKELMRGRLVADLVEVLDNLDRSTQGAEAGWSAQDLLMGMKMVQRQFLEKLQNLGLTLIDPLGKPFDPNEAEALNVSATFEEPLDNTVSRVYTRGYRLGERVIRVARVEVARYTPKPDAQA